MAYLNLNKMVEPVDFGGKECMPKIDAETKLRLSQIKNYDETSILVLASAFPDDESYVRDFLKDMSMLEIQELHAYLIGGARMVEILREQFKKAFDSAMGGEK